LKHELTHVARNGRAMAGNPGRLRVGPADDSQEREAEQNAERTTAIPTRGAQNKAGTIQRKMRYTYAMVDRGLKLQSKIATFHNRGREFSEILRALKAYEAANRLKDEVKLLMRIRNLVNRWQGAHEEDKTSAK